MLTPAATLFMAALLTTPVGEKPYVPYGCKGTTATINYVSFTEEIDVTWTFPASCRGQKFRVTYWDRPTGNFDPHVFVNDRDVTVTGTRLEERYGTRWPTSCAFEIDFNWYNEEGEVDKDSPFFVIQRGQEGETKWDHPTTSPELPTCEKNSPPPTSTIVPSTSSTTTGPITTTSPTSTSSTAGTSTTSATSTSLPVVSSGPTTFNTPNTLPETGTSSTKTGMFATTLLLLGTLLTTLSRAFKKD